MISSAPADVKKFYQKGGANEEIILESQKEYIKPMKNFKTFIKVLFSLEGWK